MKTYTKNILIGEDPLYVNDYGYGMEKENVYLDLVAFDFFENYNVGSLERLYELFCGAVNELARKDCFLVYPFDKTPNNINKYCCLNGGDEDYLVICKKTDYENGYHGWIENIGAYETDCYEFGENLVFVACHA